VNSQSLLALALAALLCPTSFAQKPGDQPLSETDLLRQIETLTPNNPSTGKTAGSPGSFFDSGLADAPKSGGNKKDKGLKKSKGPTEITALEATFDQKANLAVFLGEVVVKDPEFNVICDKLTAYLKSDKSKGKGDAAKPAAPAASEDAPKKSGGLERAIAESTGDRRVIITQDKTEADGTITQSVGKADKATYDAVSGDVVLTGSPEVLQGINRVVAVDPGTVMTLNRDGRMRANGLTKSTIVDKASSGL
jgi:lipopolysaccharide export system protein LptA